MKIIVGLGNPGQKYAQTRHNVGFMVCDQLAQKMGARWQEQKKSEALIAKTQFEGGEYLLIKPQSFMNRSGQPVRSVMAYFNLVQDFSPDQQLEQLHIIHDDLDIEVGSWKVQLGTGPKGHNGLLSLYQHLHTKQFWHVRVGVDGRGGDRSIPPDKYVLQSFSAEEKTIIQRVTTEVTQRLLS